MTFKQIQNLYKFEEINPKYYCDLQSEIRNKKSYVVGAMGCKLSHLNIIKIAKERIYRCYIQ